MPTTNRSTFTTAEVLLQWVKILVPAATAVGMVIGFVISVAIWKSGVDAKLTNLLENQKTQGQKLDWIMQHYTPMPAGSGGARVDYPNVEVEKSPSERLY